MTGAVALLLTDDEESMLAGRDGEAVALAMRIIVRLAKTLQAPRLVRVSSAHIDSALFHGQASLDFANRLVELGAKVRIPTTLNVGSMDLLHPQYVRTDTEEQKTVAEGGRELMSAYLAMGCTASWTCAPYQLPDRPRFGEHIAWAESNAIVFANSVLGARTDRYGDFLDIAAAITGRAPLSGLQATPARRGQVIFDCTELSDKDLAEETLWPTLGYIAGTISGSKNPVFVGLPADASEDQLKALGAAAASAGGVGMFHVVGRTPEAPTLTAALHGNPPEKGVKVNAETIRRARRKLSTFEDGPIDAVSIGTPHASFDEITRLAALFADGPPPEENVDVFVSTSRRQLALAEESGAAEILRHAGVRIVVDTCTYVTAMLSPTSRRVMTNSGKWAHYAPANIGVEVVLGSMAECVASARAGRVVLADEDA
ncbi:aconitase X [Microbacterium sp. GCS4]|uniref:aconitase X n=1 Tax=Microbacterium sp. GCS4 TaxID=1692239 RepID=UPI000680AFA5|nr:aconitase X catalytic domain-containing protein [Microbacterium sp. GCS4]KNY04020.1 aconitase subunit 1 [Microbacterium sp. GCS4]